MLLTLLVMALISPFRLLTQPPQDHVRAGIGGVKAVPYIDLNPHKGRPKWVGYANLAVLAALTALVVAFALTRG